jgi:hypothetical protein
MNANGGVCRWRPSLSLIAQESGGVGGRRVPPTVLLAGLLALLGGVAGFRLVPDSGLYARTGLHPWPSPLGGIAGSAGGMTGLIALSSISAGACVALMPGRARGWFLAASSYWLLFPGVDALGLVFVLLLARSSAARAGVPAWIGAALAHPVAALTSWPLLWRRDALGVATVAVMTAAAVVGVGLYDGFATTDRYALPLVGVLALGVRS